MLPSFLSSSRCRSKSRSAIGTNFSYQRSSPVFSPPIKRITDRRILSPMTPCCSLRIWFACGHTKLSLGDLDQLLADVLAAEHPEERRDRVLDAVGHRLAVFELALA